MSKGTAIDWAHGKAKIPFVYRVDLRDEGTFGYALPPELILPTAEEAFAGLKAAAGRISSIVNQSIRRGGLISVEQVVNKPEDEETTKSKRRALASLLRALKKENNKLARRRGRSSSRRISHD
jgi:hypothetical protein